MSHASSRHYFTIARSKAWLPLLKIDALTAIAFCALSYFPRKSLSMSILCLQEFLSQVKILAEKARVQTTCDIGVDDLLWSSANPLESSVVLSLQFFQLFTTFKGGYRSGVS